MLSASQMQGQPGFKIYRSGMPLQSLVVLAVLVPSYGVKQCETCMEKQKQFDDQGLQIPSGLVNDSCVLSLFRFVEQGPAAIHGLLFINAGNGSCRSSDAIISRSAAHLSNEWLIVF